MTSFNPSAFVSSIGKNPVLDLEKKTRGTDGKTFYSYPANSMLYGSDKKADKLSSQLVETEIVKDCAFNKFPSQDFSSSTDFANPLTQKERLYMNTAKKRTVVKMPLDSDKLTPEGHLAFKQSLLSSSFLNFQEVRGYFRRYPPLSFSDTIRNGRGVNGNGKETFISDKEILKVHKEVEDKTLQKGSFFKVDIHKTEQGKWVMVQPARRACTAAATAMLILDKGGQVDIPALLSRNLGEIENMVSDIEKAGLIPLVTHTKGRSLEELNEHLKAHGPAIVSVGGEIGNHVIIVDAVHDDGVDIRDSFHGWSVKITKEAFLSRYSEGPLIQIQ
tara:strand:+ start:4725 stop:5717 length:993 start_codon:yes stop_codon:yes gene_type:complete